MRVDPRTWHARRFDHWRANLPKWHRWSLENEKGPRTVSLCPYFWVVVVWAPIARFMEWLAEENFLDDFDWRKALQFSFGVVLLPALVLGFIGWAGFMLGLLAYYLWLNLLGTLLWILAILGGVLVALLIGVGLLVLHDRRSSRKDDAPAGAPSMVKEWAVAKKQKVCPLIEFDYREAERV